MPKIPTQIFTTDFVQLLFVDKGELPRQQPTMTLVVASIQRQNMTAVHMIPVSLSFHPRRKEEEREREHLVIERALPLILCN